MLSSEGSYMLKHGKKESLLYPHRRQIVRVVRKRVNDEMSRIGAGRLGKLGKGGHSAFERYP